MKKSLLLISMVLVSLNSCNLPEDELPKAEVGIIATFVVDATDNTFEGGATLVLEKNQQAFFELPVVVSLREANGNAPGAVGLSYSRTGLQFFDAELNQAGIPRIFKPNLLDPSEFTRADQSFELPNNITVLDLDGPYSELFQTAFEAIDNLELLTNFFDGDGLFGRYLYKPSEDVPENWKWIIVAYDQ